MTDPSGPASKRVILHLGAHKTASTHFNRLLRHNQRLTDKFDVATPKKKDIRGVLTSGLGLSKKPQALLSGSSDILEDLASGKTRVLISDENILGIPNTIVGAKRIYPNALKRLRGVHRMLQPHDIEIMLSVREMSEFIISSYGETLRSGEHVSFEDYSWRLEVEQISWVPLVQDIVTVFPDTPVTIWRYEHYMRLVPQLMHRILGRARPKRLRYKALEKVVRPGLSQRAVEEVERCLAEDENAESKALMDQMVRAYPKSPQYPAPKPWTEAQKRILRRNYRKDLKEIAELPNVTVLRPHSKPNQKAVAP